MKIGNTEINFTWAQLRAMIKSNGFSEKQCLDFIMSKNLSEDKAKKIVFHLFHSDSEENVKI